MIKRVSDVLFAVFWLIVTTPVIGVIAILISLDSSEPILYVPSMSC
jgi:lipopolysaccharide/colanic/teichoic acid biosynthesis glycosyltransferase